MSIRQPERRPSHPFTGGPEPLEPGQRLHLAGALAGLVPNWSVELHCDVLGEATIVVPPDDPDDDICPTLIVYADKSAFHLEELCGEDYRKLGVYRGWADVLRAVRIRLIWEMPIPATRH
jgi:hypothetical protein